MRPRSVRLKVQDRLRGILCHIGLPDTVASFRTWRGFRAPIAQPPKACAVKRWPLKRREWDSNPRWSYPHTRFPSVLLKPLGHLSDDFRFKLTFRLYHNWSCTVAAVYDRIPLLVRRGICRYCDFMAKPILAKVRWLRHQENGSKPL